MIRQKLFMLAILPLLSLGCCQHQMRKFDVTVALDASMRDESTHRLRPVEVNLVAVSPEALGAWESKSITDFFKPPDPMRLAADKAVLRLGANAPSVKFSATDPLWETWKSHGASTLVILSDYPRQSVGLPGEQDPRRRVLTLDECRWGDRHALEILVKSDGITVVTKPAD